MTYKTIHNSITDLGAVIRVITYTPPLYINTNERFITEKKEDEIKETNKERSHRRAKSKLFDLAEINSYYSQDKPVFVTYTFAKQTNDYNHAIAHVRRSNRRLNKINAKYIFIPELHQSGNIHFHAIVWTKFLTINQWKNIWPYGSVDIQLMDNIRSTSAYITKYLTKETIDFIPKHKPMYLRSRNLIIPETVYNLTCPIEEKHILYSSISENKKIIIYENRKNRLSGPNKRKKIYR